MKVASKKLYEGLFFYLSEPETIDHSSMFATRDGGAHVLLRWTEDGEEYEAHLKSDDGRRFVGNMTTVDDPSYSASVDMAMWKSPDDSSLLFKGHYRTPGGSDIDWIIELDQVDDG